MHFRRRHIAFLTVAVLGATALIWVRNEAHGFSHAFSTEYWSDRISGRDLYDAGRRYLRHGDRSVPEVALTFDDGPHPESARQILAILKKEGIKATFFLVGSRIKENPELVRQILADGHLVGNHTQDHLRLTELRPDQIANEMHDCETNLRRVIPGAEMNYFRPPGMRFNKQVLRQVREDGYIMVGWSEAAKDFISAKHPHADPEQIRERVVDQVENGSIILLHDIPATAEVLQSVIHAVKRQGFRFVTVEQMLDRLASAPVMSRSRAKMKP